MSASTWDAPGGPAEHRESSLAQALATPHVMDVSTQEGPDGDWLCRLEYVELDGCVVARRDALDAYDSLEHLREEWIIGRIAKGLPVPSPRPALRC